LLRAQACSLPSAALRVRTDDLGRVDREVERFPMQCDAAPIGLHLVPTPGIHEKLPSQGATDLDPVRHIPDFELRGESALSDGPQVPDRDQRSHDHPWHLEERRVTPSPVMRAVVRALTDGKLLVLRPGRVHRSHDSELFDTYDLTEGFGVGREICESEDSLRSGVNGTAFVGHRLLLVQWVPHVGFPMVSVGVADVRRVSATSRQARPRVSRLPPVVDV